MPFENLIQLDVQQLDAAELNFLHKTRVRTPFDLVVVGLLLFLVTGILWLSPGPDKR